MPRNLHFIKELDYSRQAIRRIWDAFYLCNLSDSRLITGSVFVNVTEVSNGFLLETPEAQIIDEGTQYAVILDSLATEVHVVDGSVIWTPTNADVDFEDRITTGDARRYLRSEPSRANRIPFGKRQFVRRIDEQSAAIQIILEPDAASPRFTRRHSVSFGVRSDQRLFLNNSGLIDETATSLAVGEPLLFVFVYKVESNSTTANLRIYRANELVDETQPSISPIDYQNTHDKKLTTQQAADILNASRPFLNKILDLGDISHRKVGRNRRVKFSDVLAHGVASRGSCSVN